MNYIHDQGNSTDFGGKIPQVILAHPIKIVAQCSWCVNQTFFFFFKSKEVITSGLLTYMLVQLLFNPLNTFQFH